MTRLVFLLALVSGCGLIDAATSDRPNTRQANALADIFSSIGKLAKVTKDPATASLGDLADAHNTLAYRRILDPDGTPAAREASLEQPLDGCFTREGASATWDCAFTLNNAACTAKGMGAQGEDGTVSGSSTMACAGSPPVTIVASAIVFDEKTGKGGGKIRINPEAGWAELTLDGLGFCTGEASVRPNKGRVIVDGTGPLEGLPFDPLTIRFTGDPVCGTALID